MKFDVESLLNNSKVMKDTSLKENIVISKISDEAKQFMSSQVNDQNSPKHNLDQSHSDDEYNQEFSEQNETDDNDSFYLNEDDSQYTIDENNDDHSFESKLEKHFRK